jgi:signal transduction histidine kinase
VFSALGMVTIGLQIIIDSLNNVHLAVAIDVVMLIAVIITYILNEKRKHLLAKLLFVGLLNSIVFLYGNVIPKSTGIYFYFFPVIGIAALIFDSKDRVIRNVFIAIPLIFVGILELSKYQLFGPINIQEGVNDPYSFPVNLFVSLTLTAVSIYQLMLINREIDKNRLAITDELKLKNEDLQKSNTELDHFVYSTSHDLKAPLSSISGLINIAKIEIKDEKSIDYFDMIDGRIDKLNLFIKDIIDLSRNSRLELVKEEVDISLLIENAIENNRYMENANSIEFKKNIEKSNSYYLDRARLEVVLNNLISNAIKYHKKTGDRWIEVSVKRLKTNVRIVIKDNGVGISKEHHKKVFDMFYRGHEESEGSGLGLYIVSDVVKKMKGEIILKSEEGQGTEMTINIPMG